MKTKHTPGPWALESDYSLVMQGEVQASALIGPDSATDEEKRANAHLIAAAPEMLEALEKIKETLDIIKGGEFFAMNYELLLVNRAISKAKGEK